MIGNAQFVPHGQRQRTVLNLPASIIRGKKTFAAVATDPRAHVSASASQPFAGCLSLDSFGTDTHLRREWARLEKLASLPMQCQPFVAALADSLATDADIRIHFVHNGARLVALLPLSRDEGYFGRLKVIGEEEVCEPGDALSRDGEAVAQLADIIVREKKVVDLDRVPAGSPLVPALVAAIRGKGIASVRPAISMPTIRLDEGWEDPASQFNSGRRSDFRRAARKASEFGEVSFEILSPTPEEFDALFDEAISVEARSWKRDVGTAIAVDRCKERFFRHYFRSASERGEFRLAFIRIGGQVVAMQLALECLDRYWLFKIGFDEDYARCSPGTLLMLHTIGWAANRKLRAYELLGNVEPWIAQLWTRQNHGCVRIRCYPYNLRGAAALTADGLIWMRKKFARASA